jgi:hypothetical protein
MDRANRDGLVKAVLTSPGVKVAIKAPTGESRVAGSVRVVHNRVTREGDSSNLRDAIPELSRGVALRDTRDPTKESRKM